MLLTPTDSLAAWSALIVAVLTASGKMLSLLRTAKTQTDTSMWTRRDQMLDDSREDNDRLRILLKEKDEECQRYQRERDECWDNANRRRWPRMKPEDKDKTG
jgi:hypothetical protein